MVHRCAQIDRARQSCLRTAIALQRTVTLSNNTLLARTSGVAEGVRLYTFQVKKIRHASSYERNSSRCIPAANAPGERVHDPVQARDLHRLELKAAGGKLLPARARALFGLGRIQYPIRDPDGAAANLREALPLFGNWETYPGGGMPRGRAQGRRGSRQPDRRARYVRRTG